MNGDSYNSEGSIQPRCVRWLTIRLTNSIWFAVTVPRTVTSGYGVEPTNDRGDHKDPEATLAPNSENETCPLQFPLQYDNVHPCFDCKLLKSGAPGETRTPDPLLRRQTLYPAELRAHPQL